MFDVKKAMDEARKEVAEENFNKAKEQYKEKLRQLEKAKLVVTNIEREIADLELRLSIT
jgi:TRAP-type C4-dicarboxylate transport system substrate-binding protein